MTRASDFDEIAKRRREEYAGRPFMGIYAYRVEELLMELEEAHERELAEVRVFEAPDDSLERDRREVASRIRSHSPYKPWGPWGNLAYVLFGEVGYPTPPHSSWPEVMGRLRLLLEGPEMRLDQPVLSTSEVIERIVAGEDALPAANDRDVYRLAAMAELAEMDVTSTAHALRDLCLCLGVGWDDDPTKSVAALRDRLVWLLGGDLPKDGDVTDSFNVEGDE